MTKEKQKQKVSEFIVRGEEIGKKEKTEYIGVSQVKGPEYEAWMSEINVFNERNLKEHPLYSDIHSSFFHRNTDRRSYQNMMGLLQALLNDEEYWGESTFLLNETSLINSEEARTKTDMAPIIFISHRTTDRAIADILLDFFIATGISREKIFCSSLPGNDVRERISVEVKEALQNSCLNIAILSDDYYKSAYCLNEAGILWFEKTPVIPIALPEINQRPLSSIPSLIQENADDEREREYDVFISHASEDKDAVVRPLANALKDRGIVVWYDEFEMKIGDSLRRKIDKGLANSKFGIVIISRDFIRKGWTNYELDGIITRSVSGEQVLLPIWHNITKQEVIDYSPSLADKVARNTAINTIEEIADEITELIRG